MHSLYREQHPIPFVIWHWANLLSMFFLILSGFYIHYPIFPGLMGVARGIHFFWMFVLCISFAFRIIAAFFVKDAIVPGTREKELDIKNWLPQPENRHQLIPWVKYYLFFKKTVPISGKYGVLQKIAYLATIPITLAAAYTGFCLWGPTSQWAIFEAGTAWISTLFNGGVAANNPMDVRIVHYYIMWVVIIFTIAHVYLANIYNFSPSKIILFWEETEFEGH